MLRRRFNLRDKSSYPTLRWLSHKLCVIVKPTEKTYFNPRFIFVLLQHATIKVNADFRGTMMKKLTTTFLFCFFVICTIAQNPTLEWAKAVEVLGWGYAQSSCESLKIDNQGNVISTGYFKSASDFDPGSGTTILDSDGGQAGYVQKLDANGDFLWAVQIGGTGSIIRSTSIALDAAGNIYCIGYFYATVDFDPGVGTANLTSLGGTDAFVLKLNPDGTFAWVKQIGGSGGQNGWSIAVDANGEISLVGTFEGTADFDPGAGVSTLTATGYSDLFVAKLDGNGDFLWAKHMGSPDPQHGMDEEVEHTLDDSGNLLITGWFYFTIDFDPGPGTLNLTASGLTDMFILKLSPSGNLIWAKQVGERTSSGTGIVLGLGISSDAAEDVYLIGYFEGNTDFNPGSFITSLIASSQDIFVLKLDSNGDFVWVKKVAGNGDNWGQSIATKPNGDSYITGGFMGTADFDMGAGDYDLTATGTSRDIFVQKIDTDGNFEWAFSMGSDYVDYGRAIEVDDNGNVYTMGYYVDAAFFNQAEIDFDPGVGTFNLGSNSDDPQGFFIQKLSDAGSPVEISENNHDETLVVYPNPTNGAIRVKLDGFDNPIALNIYDMTGKLVDNQKLVSNTTVDCLLPESSGIYLVQIVGLDGTTTNMKVINQ